MLDTFTFSDKIPEHARNSPDRWHKSELHIVNVVDVAHGFPHNVPLNFKRLLCWNMGKEGHEGFAWDGGSKRRIPSCGGCGRPFSWFGHWCYGCGDFFIQDFFLPQYCNLYPTCWTCTPQLPWDFCPNHNSKEILKYPVREPEGLNPKKYTQEEIDDVFGPGFFD